jgi:hypothetical protein
VLGELIGLGLIALASALSRDPSDEELYEAFMDRLEKLESETVIPILVARPWIQSRLNPCALKQRQAVTRFQDLLDHLRAVTRHPNFKGGQTLYKGCLDKSSQGMTGLSPDAVEQLFGSACRSLGASGRRDFNALHRLAIESTERIKNECPAVWTEDQGLEGIRFRVKGPIRLALREALQRKIPVQTLKVTKDGDAIFIARDVDFRKIVEWMSEPDRPPFPPGTMTWHNAPGDEPEPFTTLTGIRLASRR